MNFTLYIDESGDFKTNRGQWVLSGILFAEKFEDCEKHLTNKLKGMPNELGVKSMKDFHLTEFRRDYGHEVAVEMADKTIAKLDKLSIDYYCLAAINYSKASLSDREKTYRLMLADVIALCDTVIEDHQVISKLDLVVATRTIDGELQTSESNINQEIIQSLPLALEVDLATKGLVQLIGKHINIHMEYANNSWGLICADFLANLNYHNKRPNEKKILDNLDNKGRYYLFESFGGFEIRKANIAERNKDFNLSLYRWLIIHHKKLDIDKSKQAIQRLLHKLFNLRGTTGKDIAFEAVLDRLWRAFNLIEQHSEFVDVLKLLEDSLQRYCCINKVNYIDKYLFRLRNLLLIVFNHLGRTVDASELSKLQHIAIPKLALNPENFQMILDFKASEIEIYVNSMNFEEALNLSKQYCTLIKNYKSVWQLLIEGGDIDLFDNSRASIKAEMVLTRCTILNAGINNQSLSEMPDSLIALENRLTNEYDRSRYRNYKIMYLLKQKRFTSAVLIAEDYLVKMDQNKINHFDLFWCLKAINDALLNESIINLQSLETLIKKRVNGINLIIKGHPIDLIFRELALLEHILNNKSMALKYIRRCKSSFDLVNSKIAQWLQILIQVHEDVIKGNNITLSEYLKPLNNDTFALKVLEKESNSNVLQTLRFFSPY